MKKLLSVVLVLMFAISLARATSSNKDAFREGIDKGYEICVGNARAILKEVLSEFINKSALTEKEVREVIKILEEYRKEVQGCEAIRDKLKATLARR